MHRGRGRPNAIKKSLAPNLASAGKRHTVDVDNSTAKKETKDVRLNKKASTRGNRAAKVYQEESGVFSHGVSDKERVTGPSDGYMSQFRSGGQVTGKRNMGLKHKTGLSSKLADTGEILDDESILNGLLKDEEETFIEDLKESDVKPVCFEAPTTSHKAAPVIQSENDLLNIAQKSEEDDSTGHIVFVQFPALFSKLASNFTQTAQGEPQAPTSSTAVQTPTPSAGHSLQGLPPGKIGKLQFLKSGKMRMLIGESSFDVEMASPSALYQEVIKVDYNCDNIGYDGNYHVLGPVESKIKCVQPIDTLIQDPLT